MARAGSYAAALLIGLAASIGLALPRAAVVLAHAVLRDSDPRAGSVLPASATAMPLSVRLFFNEPVQPVQGGIVVIAPSGQRLAVTHGAARPGGAALTVAIDATEIGVYTVRWAVVSDDTHPARGSFFFALGDTARPLGAAPPGAGSGVPRPALLLQAAGRFLHLAGYALAFGPLLFGLVVLRDDVLRAGVVRNDLLRADVPRVEQPAYTAGTHDDLPRAEQPGHTAAGQLWRLVGLGIVLLLLAEPLALLAQTVSLSPGGRLDAAVAGDALASSFGRVFAQRLGAALLLWVLSIASHSSTDRSDRVAPAPQSTGSASNTPAPASGAHAAEAALPAPGGDTAPFAGPVVYAALLLGVAFAVADGQASHAATSGPGWLGFTLNAVHLVAMAAWVGGLAALLAVWRLPALRGGGLTLLGRFGMLAAVALVALVISGTMVAMLHLTRPTDLFATSYGRVLTSKLVVLLAVLLLVLAAWRGKLRHRRRWWHAEAAVLLLLIGLAALLVSLPPPA